jgi:hypothetical protein
MPKVERISNLQLEQDLAFQRREWKAEQVGQAVLGCLLIAALAGLLGSGPASAAQAVSPSQRLKVQYQRFVRRGAPASLLVELRQDSGAAVEDVELQLSRSYLEDARIEAVTPAPNAAAAGASSLRYRFATRGSVAAFRFDLVPLSVGVIRGRIQTDGGDAVEFWQMSYP